jgi:uncharacterized protein
MWIALISGWWLGLGSLGHCLGMCGPIALVIPYRGENGKTRWDLMGFYQLGRVSTYAGIGFLIGMLGYSISWKIPGQSISILAGVFLLGVSLLYLTSTSLFSTGISSPFQKLTGKAWAAAFNSKRPHHYYLAGIANGLLPCGMVYAAAIAALGLAPSGGSVWLMLGFGIGTLPAFALIPWLSIPLQRFKKTWSRLVPYTMAAAAIWLIVRGTSINEVCHDTDHSRPVPMCVSGE